MSIAVSVYDFFAYTLPGVFYLLVLAYFARVAGLVSFDRLTFADLSVLLVVLLVIPAYILGLAFATVAQKWARLFERNALTNSEIAAKVFQSFPQLRYVADPKDWHVFWQFMRLHNTEIFTDIERLNAMHIMLCNLSFAFCLIVVVQVVEFIRSGISVAGVLVLAVTLLLVFLTGRESAKFRDWFYETIFRSAAALCLRQQDFVERTELLPGPVAAGDPEARV